MKECLSQESVAMKFFFTFWIFTYYLKTYCTSKNEKVTAVLKNGAILIIGFNMHGTSTVGFINPVKLKWKVLVEVTVTCCISN